MNSEYFCVQATHWKKCKWLCEYQYCTYLLVPCIVYAVMGMSTDLDCVYVSIKLKDEKNKVNNIAINYYSNRSTRTIATSRGDKKKIWCFLVLCIELWRSWARGQLTIDSEITFFCFCSISNDAIDYLFIIHISFQCKNKTLIGLTLGHCRVAGDIWSICYTKYKNN